MVLQGKADMKFAGKFAAGNLDIWIYLVLPCGRKCKDRLIFIFIL